MLKAAVAFAVPAVADIPSCSPETRKEIGMGEPLEELRKAVAIGNRIIGLEISDIGGHLSARIPGTNEMYLRCRGGGDEGGAKYTNLHHVRRVDFDGEGSGKRHFSPAETPIHGEIYRARSEVGAVIHAHPHYAMLCSIAGIDLRPVFAAYNTGAAALAIVGVPLYPRGATIISKAMALEMLESMGGRDALLLKGHGIVTTGTTVQQAVSRALALEQLAKVMWELDTAGKAPPDISGYDYQRYDPRDPNRPRPPENRGGQAVPDEERGFMVSYVNKLQETIGLPSWDLDEEG